MKLHVAFSILFIGFSGSALANELSVNEITEGSAQHSGKITTQSSQPSSALSVLLYLPLIDDAAWSNMMTQAQLIVTPTTTLTVRAIRVTGWNSTDGSCMDEFGTYTIDNGVGVTVNLISGHAYNSTDASNFALTTASGTIFSVNYDNTFQLLDNNLNSIGASACITATTSPIACDTNDCGWNSPRNWGP